MMSQKVNSYFYRPDIDGLRALAIIAVVLFHAYPEWFSSGFVGVDIFFVISGFLITSIIVRELNNNHFSYKNFFARRIKRIFPGLILILIFCIAAAWLVLLPYEYQKLSKDTQAGSLFFANFRFYKEAGYFDVEALQKPLLHLWSLAVEEQFYILWPIMLLLAHKMRFSLLGMTLLLAAISFGLNIYFIKSKPDFVFYLPQTRFWELLMGGALTFIYLPVRKNLVIENALATLGLALIIYAIFGLEEGAQYPGFLALFPILGTFFLILAGSQGWLNKKLLSHRYLVAIGLISFPLYLWHWPLLSFARILNSGLPSWEIRALIIFISLVLAGMTYHFLEKPIRKKSTAMAIPLLLMMAVIATFSTTMRDKKIITYLSQAPEITKVAEAINDWDFPGSKLQKFIYNDMSLYQFGTATNSILFFGDSNVQQYAPRATYLLSNNPLVNQTIIFATRPGCPPIPNVYSKRKSGAKCLNFVDHVIAFADQPHITTVVIGAQWLGYFDSSSHYFKDDQSNLSLAEPEGIEKAFLALDEMIKKIRAKNKKVYIISNIPIGPEFDPANLVKRSLKTIGEVKVVGLSERVYFTDSDKITARLKKIAKQNGATVLDPKIDLCKNDRCQRITAQGEPIYKDEAHLRPFYVEKSITFLDDLILH